ncbi:hypothetical protein GCM10016455_06370 [Aliiroseovarius zhejiangensis]|uniref:Uncharacterized protein n=1 Tax=Aliiroseovarius zhejiangensis TaxID=1632025 RepID=A0ABQ3IRU0_9RHOB|nr:hypothetical protein GCM10016455_06370 [Aliiroseovarius zhejiangensis]
MELFLLERFEPFFFGQPVSLQRQILFALLQHALALQKHARIECGHALGKGQWRSETGKARKDMQAELSH